LPLKAMAPKVASSRPGRTLFVVGGAGWEAPD
jgi:hypothetical protein